MAVATAVAKGDVDFSHVFSLKHNSELFILGFGVCSKADTKYQLPLDLRVVCIFDLILF